MSETKPDLRERLLRVAMAHFEEIVSEHDDEFGRFWRDWLREAAAALAVPRQPTEGPEGYCAICYHPLDRCSHCDVPLPHGQDVRPPAA